jgi:pimeloyl-ACP methyl ester carboxylesterase
MAIFKTKSGMMIYYKLTEKPKKNSETYVLIGGLSRDHTIWRKLIPLLKKDYQVLIFDNRDSGQSTTDNETKYNIADLANDVAELIVGLNLTPAHILGHSMGGFIAIHFAANHPDLITTVSLCSTADKQVPAAIDYLKNKIKEIETMPNAIKPVTRETVMSLMKKIYTKKNLFSKKFIEEIILFEINNKYPQSSYSYKRQAQACLEHNAVHLMKKIVCPALIITGAEDKFSTPKLANTLAAKIKNAEVAIIPEASHMLQIEQPELLYKAIKKFIAKHKFNYNAN